MSSIIYLDHAATTACDKKVWQEMQPFFGEKFGNPSSLHQCGRVARAAIDTARDEVAAHFGVTASEVIFTASGTETDMLALKGVLEAEFEKSGKNHLITTAIEHKAILNLAHDLEKRGFQTTILGVDSEGRIDISELEKAISKKTAIVSVGAVNSELGTRQDLEKIGETCRGRGVWFHTDAVQLCGKEKIDLEKLPVDLLSVSAHKFYGPKGVGALIIKKEVPLRPQILGGGQEKRRRAATENTPGIIGLATALKLAEKNFKKMEEVGELRNHLVERILKEIPESVCNTPLDKSVPTHANFTFARVEGESLLLRLDLEGVCASTGSACSAGSLEPSHVLLAIGLGAERANSSLRLTLGQKTTKKEIDKTVDILKKVVADLREMSPL